MALWLDGLDEYLILETFHCKVTTCLCNVCFSLNISPRMSMSVCPPWLPKIFLWIFQFFFFSCRWCCNNFQLEWTVKIMAGIFANTGIWVIGSVHFIFRHLWKSNCVGHVFALFQFVMVSGEIARQIRRTMCLSYVYHLLCFALVKHNPRGKSKCCFSKMFYLCHVKGTEWNLILFPGPSLQFFVL